MKAFQQKFLLSVLAAAASLLSVAQCASETVVELGVNGNIENSIGIGSNPDNKKQTEKVNDSKPFIVAIPNFLSPEKCAKYRSAYESSSRSSGMEQVDLATEDVEQLIEVLDVAEGRSERRGLENITKGWSPDRGLHAKYTLLTQSTQFHQDYYKEGSYTGELVSGNTAFVFLNSNPAASFAFDSTDDEKVLVPVEEGTLLIFQGSIPHMTRIDSGLVHLLGPLDTDYLVTVGGVATTEMPSEMPSSMPTVPNIECPCGNGWFAFFFCRTWRFRVCAW